MEQLKSIKETLVAQIQSQMGNLHNVNAKELGEVVDMVKDLEEAMYYCTIVKSMEESEEKKNVNNNTYYYTDHRPEPYYRDMDKYDSGRMYYTPTSGENGNTIKRDNKEGNSPQARRMYMESKEKHHDNTSTIKDLEKYTHELTNDILEMVEKATPDEKQMLKNKLNTLAQKIV